MCNQRAFVKIRTRRKARKLAGIGGLIMAGGVALAVALEHALPLAGGPATYLLLLAWPIMAVIYGAAILLAPLDAEPPPSKHSFESLVALPHGEYESLFYPMAATSLLAPLTLHFVAYALVSHGAVDLFSRFDGWIALAGLISTPALAALVVLCHRFAKAKTEALGVVADDDGATLHALFLTGLFAAIPGVIFFFVPPLLAVLTGLFFLPPMFGIFSGVHFRERMMLDRLELASVRASDDEAFEQASELVRATAAPPTTRAGALRFLVRRYERERLRELIDAAIRSEDPLLFRTALIVALDVRHRPSVEDVHALAKRATGTTAAYVAQLLGHYETPLAQRTLVSLVHHGSPDARLAAVKSLGRVGDLSAIPILRRIAVRHLAERGLDTAVEIAVERIQDRCATGPAGALALIEIDERSGAVSDPVP